MRSMIVALCACVILAVGNVTSGQSADTGGMVLIPAGEFEMGDTFNEGDKDERPIHLVQLDAFYMDPFEVTNQQYAEALNWALAQGGQITVTDGIVYQYDSGTLYAYCDTTTSHPYSRITWDGSTFGVTAGKENYPMVMVSWYGAAAYANWRSAMGQKPLGYDLSTWECNWNNGYRLPTEAEWEKAARGDAANHRFPWSDSDDIQHERVNYYSFWSNGVPHYPYDTSSTQGYHPDHDNGSEPYTSPVGTFDPNGYGLYDMAGNAWEWCNDWYDPDYYNDPAATNPNPKGTMLLQNTRVTRGGSWFTDAVICRVADRSSAAPGFRNSSSGIRIVASVASEASASSVTPDSDSDNVPEESQEAQKEAPTVPQCGAGAVPMLMVALLGLLTLQLTPRRRDLR